ncbi:SRPBCC family protein [Arthrobacter sp. VKM Ac-2550]|uniref:SRPBCC family protein n=1 Tax=Crystallibacter permensis TaxID=1938888 RepID=UPI002227DBE5|nr:SRPBCC family protein [Arthrobacter sp. VKM Ac-2550]MCW2134252.1 Polyketide cyclase / dehydrase and lipid transport [Arthrobacter sp. VKM Ac-2550]
MVDVTTEILIAAPCKTVAEYAAAPDNAPEWYQNIASARWETPPPLAVGSRIAFDAAFLGRHLSYTYEIVEFRPLEKLVMRTAQGPFPMQTTYTWTEVDGASTRMTLRNNGEPVGFSRLAAPFMGMMMRKANRKDLVRIKSILEARPASA